MTIEEQIDQYIRVVGIGPGVSEQIAREMLRMMCESANLKGQREGLEKAVGLVKGGRA
jgi:hypothetical protein